MLCTNVAWQTRRMVGGNVQQVPSAGSSLGQPSPPGSPSLARLELKAFLLREAQESPILVPWLAQDQSSLAEGRPEQSGSSQGGPEAW